MVEDESWIDERRAELEEKARRGEVVTWRERRALAHPPVPPPSDDTERSLEARVRQKMSTHETLDAEERAYLGRIPGDKQY